MELKFWWAGLALLAVALLVVVIRARRAARPARTDAELLAANLGRVAQTARYRQLLRAQLIWLGVLVLSLALLVGGSALLVSRLMSVAVTTVDERSKDLVLCLDVSASAQYATIPSLDAFQQIIDGLTTERVALVLWNVSAVTVFPLNSDYDFINERMQAVRDDLTSGKGDFIAGTLAGASDDSGSLVGDGLASCLRRFDQGAAERPRTLVLSTDNEVDGLQIYQLPDAIDLALQREVLVFCIGETSSREFDVSPELAELRSECQRTGGDLLPLVDGDSPSVILEAIAAQEAAVHRTQPKRIERDLPTTGAALLSVGLLGLLLAGWRIRS